MRSVTADPHIRAHIRDWKVVSPSRGKRMSSAMNGRRHPHPFPTHMKRRQLAQKLHTMAREERIEIAVSGRIRAAARKRQKNPGAVTTYFETVQALSRQ